MRKRLLAMVMTLAMLITMVPATVFAAEGGAVNGVKLQNPKITGGVSTWDCVYFGSYPQSDGTGTTKEPMKWRVLQVTDNDAFLLADTNLDLRAYHDHGGNVTWEVCTLRGWLHTTFMSNAFTPAEQAAIKTANVENSGNPVSHISGGNKTDDEIYLLSIEDPRPMQYMRKRHTLK